MKGTKTVQIPLMQLVKLSPIKFSGMQSVHVDITDITYRLELSQHECALKANWKGLTRAALHTFNVDSP